MTSFRRKQGTYRVQDEPVRPSARQDKKNTMVCYVDLLDDNSLKVELERTAKGAALLEELFKRLDLVEKDYFGLTYVDNNTGLVCWLEPHKRIRKQNKGDYIFKFKFGVKFFVSEPSKLCEEYTRYLYYVQLRRDLMVGKLQCPAATAAELAGCTVQAEMGDYNANVHTSGYVSELKLLQSQTEQQEIKISEAHRSNQGLTAVEAECKFLEIAKRLQTYGVEFHQAIDQENIQLQLGVMASGILVFLQESRINSFSWAKITKISFKKKRFYIHIKNEENEKYHSNIIGFKIVPYRACKNVWKRCVEYHSFFRLNNPRDIQTRGALRLGSKYHYQGRTQKQALDDYNNYVNRAAFNFERTPSKRNPRRARGSPAAAGGGGATRSFIRGETPTRSGPPSNAGYVTPTKLMSPEPPGTPGTPKSPGSPKGLEYDTATGVIQENMDSTLNTSGLTSVVDENHLEIKILPDAAGKFGFNIKGGVDQMLPVRVTNVAAGSPAGAAIPALEERDEVVMINGTAVETLAHSQIVSMIKSSGGTHGSLTLVVRKVHSSEEELRATMGTVESSGEEPTPTEPPYDLPDLPKVTAETSNLLDRSMTILQKSLQDGSLNSKFAAIDTETPGLTMVAGRMEENHSKNRFRDILPYDTTRVRLQEGCSDYINASYVDIPVGSETTLNYITTQGPMATTINDLWQMVWEEEVTLMVMVTECIEKKSIRCTQYWPVLTQSSTYRGVEVTCTAETDRPGEGAVERHFLVRKGEVEIEVVHLQFCAWPHYGNPDTPDQLVRFVQLIKERRAAVLNDSPVLVHCSAGIGRTGVVLLLEAALHLTSSKTAGIYPLDLVTSMRDQRPRLLQTFPLFKFTCEAILYIYNDEMNKALAPPELAAPEDEEATVVEATVEEAAAEVAVEGEAVVEEANGKLEELVLTEKQENGTTSLNLIES